MMRLTRPVAGLALACMAFSAHALGATIKREVPANVPAIYLKNTPVKTAGGPEDPAFDGLQVWVPNNQANTIQRFDVVSNKLNGTITMPATTGGPRKLIFDGTYMWAFVMSEPRVYKYDVAGKLQSGFPLALSATADCAAFDGDFIWASTSAGALDRINVSTRAVTTFQVGIPQGAVGFDGKNVWVSGDNELVKVDGTTGRVIATIPNVSRATGTSGLTFDGEFLWADSDMSVGQVYKVDVSTNQVIATVDVYPGVHATAFDGSFLWVVCSDSDAVVKVDVRTNQVVGVVQMPPGSFPHDITFDGKFMWVTAPGTGLTHKYFARL